MPLASARAELSGDELRRELVRRFAYAAEKQAGGFPRKRGVTPM